MATNRIDIQGVALLRPGQKYCEFKASCDAVSHSLYYAGQVLMATNRIDILDAALLRPGRIDRKIEFPNPNESSRCDILKIHSRKVRAHPQSPAWQVPGSLPLHLLCLVQRQTFSLAGLGVRHVANRVEMLRRVSRCFSLCLFFLWQSRLVSTCVTRGCKSLSNPVCDYYMSYGGIFKTLCDAPI